MARVAVIGITWLFGVTIHEVGRPSSRYPATAQRRFARSFVVCFWRLIRVRPFTATRRCVSARRSLAVTAALALAVSLVAPVPAVHAATAPKGRVVLDPDDNYSHAQWNGTTYTELPITYAIAQAAKAKLESLCDTRVVISRDASTAFVDRAQRAALMTSADVSLTISLNNLTGSPWGTATDGG
jgi:N-acetylmuramoyl-L-alanine amidase